MFKNQKNILNLILKQKAQQQQGFGQFRNFNLFSQNKSFFKFSTINEKGQTASEQQQEEEFKIQQEKEKQERRKQSEQNRLKFIFFSANLGGIMIGYCLSYIMSGGPITGDNPFKDKEDSNENTVENNQKKNINNKYYCVEGDQEKNNHFNFRGTWDHNWDGLDNLSVEEKKIKNHNKSLNQQIEQLQKQLTPQEGEVVDQQNKNQIQQQIQELKNTLQTEKKRGYKYITLVRHGQYIMTDDEEGKKLTSLGTKQAKITGKRLKDLGLNFDKIYVSGMIRAKQTGEIISKELKFKQKLIEDPQLSEGFPILPSPSSQSLEEGWKQWNAQDRINSAFETYFKRNETEQDSNELFVIHGNVIRYFLCRSLQFPVEGWLRLATANCGITQLQIAPDGRVSIRRFGESGHFQKEDITFN